MIALRFLGRHKISTCYIPEVLIKMTLPEKPPPRRWR
jgi:hypothetical protein